MPSSIHTRTCTCIHTVLTYSAVAIWILLFSDNVIIKVKVNFTRIKGHQFSCQTLESNCDLWHELYLPITFLPIGLIKESEIICK